MDYGTGKGAQVEGYDIGAKTGTAEKLPRETGKYLLSYMGYAPQNNPEVLIYVVIDEPNTVLRMTAPWFGNWQKVLWRRPFLIWVSLRSKRVKQRRLKLPLHRSGHFPDEEYTDYNRITRIPMTSRTESI